MRRVFAEYITTSLDGKLRQYLMTPYGGMDIVSMDSRTETTGQVKGSIPIFSRINYFEEAGALTCVCFNYLWISRFECSSS